MSISIQITKDGFTPALERRIAALSVQRLNAAIGPAVSRQVQRHLRGLGTNKRGWPTTNFYARAARATNWRETSQGPVISINQIGMRQRYLGGRISPVRARALTIPISPVAYGHTASEFPGAFLLKTKKGAFIVQHSEAGVATPEPGGAKRETKAARGARFKGLGGNAKRRRVAFLNFLFKLVDSVDQAADPDVLPSREDIIARAKEAVLAGLSTGEERSEL